MSSEHTDTAVAVEAAPQTSVAPAPDRLMILADPDPERIHKRILLDGGYVRIGRSEQSNIVLPDKAASAEHAHLERLGANWVLRDLDSKNGTFVNETRLEGQWLLRPHDRVRIGLTIFTFLSGTDPETQLYDAIYYAAEHDALTGARNKRAFLERLAVEIVRSKRHGRPLSLLMFDLDNFKTVNDTIGHPAADDLLCRMVQVARSRLRAEDELARFGGDEFLALLPETDLSGALTVAEGLRRAVGDLRVVDDAVPITLSCGAVQWTDSDVDAEALVERCDRNLYRAKNEGRNRVAG
jgi:diguanylate cyclase (GGDEF)-like protein